MSTPLWTRCKRWLAQLSDDRSGVTAMEYGLIAAAIAVAIVGVVVLLSGEIGEMYTYISDEIGDAF